MKRAFRAAALLAILAGVVFWGLTLPNTLPQAEMPSGSPELGAEVFAAGGCASCHAAKGATGDAKLVLSGGLELKTDFGTFVAPNISPHPEAGIGRWTDLDFANAMLRGVSPEGAHYYPAFPYTSYARMSVQDVINLRYYIDTLPASDNQPADHDLSFPFTIRRGIGLWKRLNLDPDWVIEDASDARGRYLVEGPGHCGECHTPRDASGGLALDQWLSGAPNPDGPGRIPNITPHEDGIGGWSQADIVYYLETGFTPEFDSAGGSMVAVIANTSQLPARDRAAMAAYLKSVPEQATSQP